MSTRENGAGVIHDIGYQRYTGPRLGRRYAARSLYVYSMRTAFGIGRSAWAKLLPWGIFGLACIAGLVIGVVSTQAPQPVLTYVGIATTFSYAGTAYVAIIAPELVSRDLRNALLPLYFSRPSHRCDYALAKLGALASGVFAMLAAPMVIMFAVLAFNGRGGLDGIAGHAGELLIGLLAAGVHAAVLAAVALPLASLSGRRVFATGAIVGLFLITAPLASTLQEFGGGTAGQLAGLIDPVMLLAGLDDWLFGVDLLNPVGNNGPLYGLVALLVAVAGTGLLLLRYRKVAA